MKEQKQFCVGLGMAGQCRKILRNDIKMLCRPILGIWGKWVQPPGHQITTLIEFMLILKRKKLKHKGVSQIVQITQSLSVRGDLGAQSFKCQTPLFSPTSLDCELLGGLRPSLKSLGAEPG